MNASGSALDGLAVLFARFLRNLDEADWRR